MTEKHEIAGEWRKGLAISKTGKSIIDLNNNAVKIRICAKWEHEYIHRSLDGRYFITALERYDYRTFPGQDRDTDCKLRPVILYVLDEHGNVILEHKTDIYDYEREDMYHYLEHNPIQYAIELGENVVLHTNATFNVNTNKLNDFNPIDYLKKIKSQELPYVEVYYHNIDDYDFLKYREYINSRTTENGEILCGNSIYDNENRQLLYVLPKYIEPLGNFENGVCKVGVVSDYRDFIVVTSNAKIVKVYESPQLGLLKDFLDALIDSTQFGDVKQYELLTNLLLKSVGNIKKKRAVDIKSNKGVFKLPDGAKVYDIITIDEEVEIEKYLIGFPSEYDMWNGHTMLYNDKFGIKRLHSKHDATKYFFETVWYEITGENGKQIDKLIFDTECNRPNFIRDIERIEQSIRIDDILYSVYKFECRPFGYITKDGSFNYNFDVDNIEW